MDQKIEQYLISLVNEVLNSPNFSNLPQEQKVIYQQKIRTFLDSIVIDTIIDNLNDEQINSLKDIPADSQQMEDKIEEYSSQIPFLAEELEDKLKESVETLKTNPQTLT